MKREQGILDKPLDQPVLPGRDRPLVAHVKALLAVHNGKSVPQEVREVVLEYANRNKEDLNAQFELWDKTIDLGLANIMGSMAFDNLTSFIALSYGIEDKTHHELRRIDIAQAFQIAGLEDIDNRW